MTSARRKILIAGMGTSPAVLTSFIISGLRRVRFSGGVRVMVARW